MGSSQRKGRHRLVWYSSTVEETTSLSQEDSQRDEKACKQPTSFSLMSQTFNIKVMSMFKSKKYSPDLHSPENFRLGQAWGTFNNGVFERAYWEASSLCFLHLVVHLLGLETLRTNFHFHPLASIGGMEIQPFLL